MITDKELDDGLTNALTSSDFITAKKFIELGADVDLTKVYRYSRSPTNTQDALDSMYEALDSRLAIYCLDDSFDVLLFLLDNDAVPIFYKDDADYLRRIVERETFICYKYTYQKALRIASDIDKYLDKAVIVVGTDEFLSELKKVRKDLNDI